MDRRATIASMTPAEAAYIVRHDCDRRNPEVKRILDESDRVNAEQDERALREDPTYAKQWREGLQRMADEIDARIAAEGLRRVLPEIRKSP